MGAFAQLFQPFLAARILLDSPELLVVDKPSGLVVHGGDAKSSDLVTRLGDWLRARGSDDYLGVHQRLDVGTSGVLLFTRDRELNAVIAKQMEAHDVERVYVAAVTLAPGAPPLRDSALLEQRLETLAGQSRIVKSGGKPVITAYRVLERHGERALVELRPQTGRTHQLRVQLAAIGAPIAGDAQYGGAPAFRLMLHARRLALKEPRQSFEAEVPDEILDFARGRPLSLGSPARLRRALADAGVHRYPLAHSNDVFRLVNAAGDGVPGVTIDRYADFCVLAIASGEAFERRQELAELLLELGARGVYLKVRARADLRRASSAELAPSEPIAGERAEALVVREGPARFLVDLAQGLSTGLFVDQRDNRERVAEICRGRRVLNLFSYTCSFSVRAALGGAAHVTSVDLSARALEHGRENFRLNALDPALHAFVRADVVEWLARARRRGERFEVIVLDPPSFSTSGKRGTFRVSEDYARVAEAALAVLGPGGRLLAVTNHRKTSLQALRKMIHAASRAAHRTVLQLKDLAPPLDCPPDPDGALSAKSVLVSVD